MPVEADNLVKSQTSMRVASPLESPSVLFYLKLFRRTGFLKSWKACVGVFTRDGFLHLFDCDWDEQVDQVVIRTKGAGTTVMNMNKGSTCVPKKDLHTFAFEVLLTLFSNYSFDT